MSNWLSIDPILGSDRTSVSMQVMLSLRPGKLSTNLIMSSTISTSVLLLRITLVMLMPRDIPLSRRLTRLPADCAGFALNNSNIG